MCIIKNKAVLTHNCYSRCPLVSGCSCFRISLVSGFNRHLTVFERMFFTDKYRIWQNKSNEFISNFSDLFFVFTMAEKTSVPPRSVRNPQVCLYVHVFTQILLAPLAMIAWKTTNVDCISGLANVR